MKNYQRISVDIQKQVGTLAADDLGEQVLTPDTSNTEGRVTSAELSWDLTGNTSGEGPLIVGLAHSNYSAAEMEEWFEQVLSWDGGDLKEQEIARRLIRQVGVFDGGDSGQVLNDGKPIKTKLNWPIYEGDSIDMWVYNNHTGAMTNGSVIGVHGHLNFFRS